MQGLFNGKLTVVNANDVLQCINLERRYQLTKKVPAILINGTASVIHMPILLSRICFSLASTTGHVYLKPGDKLTSIYLTQSHLACLILTNGEVACAAQCVVADSFIELDIGPGKSD